MWKIMILTASAAAFAADVPVHDQARLRNAVTRAFAPLVSQSPTFVRTGGCNSCHNQDLPVMAQQIARERGIPAGPDIEMLPDQNGYQRYYEHSGLLSAGSIGYFMLGYAGKGHSADALTDGAIRFLLTHQEPDGRWLARGNRQPLSTGDHHATAFAIQVIRKYGRSFQKAQLDASIARASAWLAETPPASNQDAAFQTMGLVWAKADPAAIQKAASTLKNRQRADGGWSQLPTLESDAYASGQSLYALALAGVPSASEHYRRGVDFLMRTQAPDGTWHVKARSKPFQPYFESGFPYGHDQWMSAAGTSWAAAAISMAVDPPKKTASR